MSNPIDGGPRPLGPTALPGKGQKVSGNEGKEAQGEQAERAAAQDRSRADAAQTSDRLQSVRDRIDQTSDVDRQRVEEIKARIAGGDYPIDADKIARKFAQFEALLAERG